MNGLTTTCETHKLDANLLQETCDQVDIAKASAASVAVIDMSNDIDQIQKLNPSTVYEKKVQAIADSDIALEEKIKLWDEAQDEHLANYERASDIVSNARERKVTAYIRAVLFTAVAAVAGYVGYRTLADQDAEEFEIVEDDCA